MTQYYLLAALHHLAVFSLVGVLVAELVSVRPGLDAATVTPAVRALVERIASRRARDLVVESIDHQPAATSPHAQAFVDAGLRLTPAGLRRYASF